MKNTIPKIPALTIVAAALVACSNSVGPGENRVLGVTHFHHDPVVISIPEVAQAGVPFEVSVRTYGGGCITQNGTDVEVSGLQAEVRPFDLYSGARICTSELRIFEHLASVRFDGKGLATVRVHGRIEPGDSVVVVEQQLTVE